MKLAAQQAMDLKTILAVNLHETKNLLGQLMLRLDGMNSADVTVREARLLCQQVSDRMVQMLLLYEIQEERLQPQLEAHNPADFLLELHENAKAWASARVRVESADLGAPDYWYFDRALIEMALMNALHNALRHAKSQIVLRTGMRGENLFFSVTDDGPGYSQEMLQAPRDQMSSVSRSGTGLGLYFSALIAAVHTHQGRQGELVLQNCEQSGGAEFMMLLP